MTINFKHTQSAHCENGVASNLLYFNGVRLSEPMVFGIGSGLLFFYFPWIKVNEAPATALCQVVFLAKWLKDLVLR